MKKLSFLVVATLILFGINTAQALEQAKKSPQAPAASNEKWDFIQFGLWFGVPSATMHTKVNGVKVGAPFCSGKGIVNGVEGAVLCGASDRVNGVQASGVLSKSKRVDGLQFSIVNSSEEVNGVQLGIVNIAKNKSFQIGLINYIEDSTLPWMILINFRF